MYRLLPVPHILLPKTPVTDDRGCLSGVCIALKMVSKARPSGLANSKPSPTTDSPGFWTGGSRLVLNFPPENPS